MRGKRRKVQNGWIDIHNHLLPGVDDGAKDWDETKKMLQIAYNEGVRQIIATPHFYGREECRTKDELQKIFIKVRKLAKDLDTEFNVHMGNEVYFHHDIIQNLDGNKINSMAGSDYLLVEFSPDKDFRFMRQSLYSLQLEGYKPILAHVERYRCFDKNIANVKSLVEMGVYIQVNASAFLGEFSYMSKRVLLKLANDELIHFIATDAHNSKSRPPYLTKCIHYLERKMGVEFVEELLYYNPMKVLKNEYI